MQIVIANPPDILDNGLHSVLFPSRCDWVGSHHPFSADEIHEVFTQYYTLRDQP